MHEGIVVDQMLKGPLASNELFRKIQPTPAVATDTTTLTNSQLAAGLIIATPTAAATYTLPTGTVFEGGPGAAMQVGDCVDCTIINTAATGTNIITLAGATGMTIVGGLEIAATPATALTSGKIRICKNAVNTYTVYRMS